MRGVLLRRRFTNRSANQVAVDANKVSFATLCGIQCALRYKQDEPAMEMVREPWDARQVASVAFGLVVFEDDLVSAPWLQSLFGLAADVHVARIAFSRMEDGPDEFATRLRDAATTILRSSPPGVIGFACTTKAIELGDDRLRNAMQGDGKTVAYVTPIHAASDALALLGAHRVLLISPYSPAAKSGGGQLFGSRRIHRSIYWVFRCR